MAKQVIWKYPVKPDATIDIPHGATILSVASQEGKPHLWAMVDAEAPRETRRFRTIATGEHFDPAGLTYLGTFHGVDGWMVFHLFEIQA